MSVEESELDYAEVHGGVADPLSDEEGDGAKEGEDEEMVELEEVLGEEALRAIAEGVYNPNDVNESIFEELRLDPEAVEQAQNAWATFMAAGESRDAVGESIYAAVFDAAPSLQRLFKTARAVMALRFMNGINQIVSSLGDPVALKVAVETLGFQHLDLEVTIPRVVIFRDAIVDLLQVELGARFSDWARDAWSTLLNYVGGAFIYIRVTYADRIKVLSRSWAQANNRRLQPAGDSDEVGEGEEGHDDVDGIREKTGAGTPLALKSKSAATPKDARSWFGSKGASGRRGSGGGSGDANANSLKNTSVPTNFKDMFMFNAAVMGFTSRGWMQEVLASFDAIVTNVSNSYRFQEECDVLGLRIAKYPGQITYSEYKSVMLASLRSLVKDWGSTHEVSWAWMWENVERMLKRLHGKPPEQEAALTRLLAALDEASLLTVRREVYATFFRLAPSGQDYFKQSTTRLHFIADKVLTMTLEMYQRPKKMVEDISGLGLRHVGYGVPTDMFGPFVTACVQVLATLTEDERTQEAFSWSLSLISRILTRVISEGSTIVMQAINVNSGIQLRKAVACAPRGLRALWVLNVQVGTHSISPLMWAIETGSLDAAQAIVVDLLTIRADRDRYYYGMDILFERHPDILRRLCLDAPAMLPILLDGLVWRSRLTLNSYRRVNYYIKHLLVDAGGAFAPATEWITDFKDPKVVCHPVVAMVTDLVWGRVAFRTFLYGKAWFLFTLLVFVLSQSVLNRVGSTDSEGADRRQRSREARVAIFACRLFVYVCCMGQWLTYHVRWTMRDFRQREFLSFGPVRLPAYLGNSQDMAGLALTMCLFLMLCLEPILHCFDHGHGDTLFTEQCEAARGLTFAYSCVSMVAILLYFFLLSDLSVFSTRVSAFVLVMGRVLSEVILFLFALTFFALAFACGVSSLEQEDPRFDGIPQSALSLYRMTFGIFPAVHFETMLEEPVLTAAAVAYIITSVIFLLNVLVAQLNCAYQASYQDMVGFARLNRGKIVCETMRSVSTPRWERFVESLRLDERIEFGEGDVGLAGGVQTWEPAGAHPTTVDTIRRFAGSTSPSAQWPPDELAERNETDRFERIEKLFIKAMKRMEKVRRHGPGSSAGGSSYGGSSLMASSSAFDQSAACGSSCSD